MNQNKIIRYSIFTGLWAILLIPFYVASGMFFPYITGKNFTFRIIVEIIFALWVYLAYVDAKYRPKFSWMNISILAFVIIMAVADFFAVAPIKAFWSNYERMDGWVTLIHLLMYLTVFGSVMKTEKNWLLFFRSSVVMSMFMAISVLMEWSKNLKAGVGDTRSSVSLGNPIYVAVYFLFNFFFVLILMYKDVIVKATSHKAGQLKGILSSWLTYLYGLAAFACTFAIWRTSTRGVILGLLGGLIITALFIALFEKENKLMRKSSLGVLIVIAVIIGGFLSIKNTQFVKNNFTLTRLAQISWSDVNGQGQARQYVWPMALKGVEEKPILGWGQEGFNYVFNKYYDPRMYSQEQWFDRAHNTPLDILVAGGILGFIAYLSIFISALCIVWKKRKTLGITDAGLLVGLLAAYFAQNLFVFDNLISYIFFYVVLAYIYSRDVEDGVTPVSKNQKSDVNYDMANYVVLPITLLILGTSLWYANMRPLYANMTLISAMQGYPEGMSKNLQLFKDAISYNSFGAPEIREQLVNITPKIANSNADIKLKQDFVDFTYTQMQEQIAVTPIDARYQFFTGIFLDNLGQYQLALPYLQKALEYSPTKQSIMYELIRCLAALGKKSEALEIGKRAYEIETENAEAKSNYIAVLTLNNKQDVAQKLFGTTTSASKEIIIRSFLIKASEYLKSGDKNAAILEVQKAIQQAPEFKTQGETIIKSIQAGTAK